MEIEERRGYRVYNQSPDIAIGEVQEPCEYDGTTLIWLTTQQDKIALTIGAAEDMVVGIGYLIEKRFPPTIKERSVFKRYGQGLLYGCIGLCYIGVIAFLIKCLQ